MKQSRPGRMLRAARLADSCACSLLSSSKDYCPAIPPPEMSALLTIYFWRSAAKLGEARLSRAKPSETTTSTPGGQQVYQFQQGRAGRSRAWQGIAGRSTHRGATDTRRFSFWQGRARQVLPWLGRAWRGKATTRGGCAVLPQFTARRTTQNRHPALLRDANNKRSPLLNP